MVRKLGHTGPLNALPILAKLREVVKALTLLVASTVMTEYNSHAFTQARTALAPMPSE